MAESEEEMASDVSFRADAHLSPGEPEWANYVKGVVNEYMAKVLSTGFLVVVLRLVKRSILVSYAEVPLTSLTGRRFQRKD